MVTLGGSHLFDLVLQQAALATELLKHLGPLLLGYDDHSRGTLTRLADDALMVSIGLDNQDIGLGDERVVLGLASQEKLFLPRRGFANDLVMA